MVEDSESLVQGFEKKNPFPNAYVVSVEKPEIVNNVVKAADRTKGYRED